MSLEEYKAKLALLEPGDMVIRLLGGKIEMELIVSEVTTHRILCGEWEFIRSTGGEIDEFLGWDGVTLTGSQLTFE